MPALILTDYMTVEQEFEFYSLVDTSGSCWEWVGKRDLWVGYGRFCIGRPKFMVGAHRVAWAVSHVGYALDSDDCVCHRCDNPPCCRPDHLFVGTRLDNVVDRLRKKRGSVKLSEADVVVIRASGDSDDILAAQFGVHATTIYSVRMGYTWKWVAMAS